MILGYVVRGCAAVCVALSLSACAPTGYIVKVPTPSGLKYEAVVAPRSAEIVLVDSRKQEERAAFSTGTLPAVLNVDNAPIDAPQFLAANLEAELASRGVPAKVSRAGDGKPQLNLTTFRMQNHRASGFSPFVTFTFLSAELDTGMQKQRFSTFVKRGKVPVWSFDEVIEPTFNQPLSVAVKELASKIATYQYGYKASDAAVQELLRKLEAPRNGDSYLDVYALGFTGNAKAIETLAKLTADTDEYVRLAAISSLGTLKATSKFDLLKSLYENRGGVWQDRAMAIKAIGDLGTVESKAFLAAQASFWETQKGLEADWTLQVIRLYL